MIRNKCLTKKCYCKLKKTKEFKKFIRAYRKEKEITESMIPLLKEMLNNELYSIFIKINYILYDYGKTNLKRNNNVFYQEYKGKSIELHLFDIVFMTKFYGEHYNLIQSVMKKIIDYKLKSKGELIIIQKILNRDIEKELFYPYLVVKE